MEVDPNLPDANTNQDVLKIQVVDLLETKLWELIAEGIRLRIEYREDHPSIRIHPSEDPTIY